MCVYLTGSLHRFADTPPQLSCQSCAKGYHTPLTGQSACAPCPISQYQSSGGQTGVCASDFLCIVSRLQFVFPWSIFQPNWPRCLLLVSKGQIFRSAWGCELHCVPARFALRLCACARCVFILRAGTFQPTSGQSFCTSCAPSQYQNASGQTGCGTCGSGQHTSQSHNASTKTHKNTQKTVTTGRYTASSGQSVCLKCDRGQFQQSGGSVCSACATGSASNSTGVSGCVQCMKGYACVSVRLAAIHAFCFRFYAASTGSTSCSVCPKGKYQPTPALSFCLDCIPGKFSNQTSATDCYSCSPGLLCALLVRVRCVCSHDLTLRHG